MGSEIIKVLENEEDGISVIISKGWKGYHVKLKDNDSGLFLPTVMIYDDEETAYKNAVMIVNGYPID